MSVPGRVSVVVTTRNSARHLEPLLESIGAQTYSDVELVVVDNGSTDGTLGIARRHADTVLDTGPERSAQRNRGVDAATGEFVLILDSDMVLDAAVVAECVSEAQATGASAVVVPERSVGTGFWAECKALERSCYEGDETIEAARFFRREAFVRHGGYDERLTGPEDWDLPARMRERGEIIGRVGDVAILHDEGHLRLLTLARKKFYYGTHFQGYMRRHPRLAAKQLRVVRPAFIRHRRRLARQPALAAGMMLMKLVEFAAGAAGLATAMAKARRRRPDAAAL
jgi:glycosyltransferase involved in cell wall biosynthesis